MGREDRTIENASIETENKTYLSREVLHEE